MKDDRPTEERTVTVTELAYCAGTSRAVIRDLLDHDLLSPVQSEPEPRFAAVEAERVRKICRIRMELEVPHPAMALVLDLLERIDRLERRLREREP